LFEGQLSQSEPPPRPRSVEDILHSLVAAHLQQSTEQAGQAAEQSTGDEQSAAQAPDHQEPASEAEAAESEQRQALLQQELEDRLNDILAASLAEAEDDGSRPGGPPPAAKHAVAALPVEEVTAERLTELGGPGTECPVCRDDLAVGQKVQVMPCNSRHAFHPQCLKPWLNQHNSCPVCRFELPTDDMAYEKRKEREAKEAEDRKGAANALSHNEFMYI
jgi:E3 ubiquitin-protein ligase AIP2